VPTDGESKPTVTSVAPKPAEPPCRAVAVTLAVAYFSDGDLVNLELDDSALLAFLGLIGPLAERPVTTTRMPSEATRHVLRR